MGGLNIDAFQGEDDAMVEQSVFSLQDRQDYLERLQLCLKTGDVEYGPGTAETYKELSGRMGERLVSFREQHVLFTPPSTASEIRYLRRFLDTEVEYRDVPELAVELLRQTKPELGSLFRGRNRKLEKKRRDPPLWNTRQWKEPNL